LPRWRWRGAERSARPGGRRGDPGGELTAGDLLLAEASPRAAHEHAAHLLSPAATLTGTCLAGVALIRLEQSARGFALFADNVMAVSALFYLFSTWLAYYALRMRSGRMCQLAEMAFLVGSVILALVLISFALEIVLV
jgi:hypothetical protein